MKLTLKAHPAQWLQAAGRLFSALPLLLMSCWAFAANLEDAAAAAPVPTVSLVYVVLFAVLFFGIIGGFFAYLVYTWRNEKDKKQGQS
jgi:heme/copper-type cytochrome/quinol oxidase subunit 2